MTNAIHKVVSIGASSNIPDFENRFFCRDSSSQEDGDKMMSEFLNHLFNMAEKLQDLIPQEIIKAADRLNAQLKGIKFSKSVCKERSLLNHLNSYKRLSVYGFNSGKKSIICSI